jgi:hypothetical protein
MSSLRTKISAFGKGELVNAKFLFCVLGNLKLFAEV